MTTALSTYAIHADSCFSRIQSSSKMTFMSNNIEVGNVNFLTRLTSIIMDSEDSPILINTGGTLIVSHNNMKIFNVSATISWVWYLLYALEGNAPITIASAGTLYINNNTMLAESGGGEMMMPTIALSRVLNIAGGTSDVGVGTQVEISSNVIMMPEYTLFTLPSVLCLGTAATTLRGLGTLSVHHNIITSGNGNGTVLSVLGTIGPISIPIFNTCRNYVNSLPCSVNTSSGVYSCASGSVSSLVGRVAQCSDTVTTTTSVSNRNTSSTLKMTSTVTATSITADVTLSTYTASKTATATPTRTSITPSQTPSPTPSSLPPLTEATSQPPPPTTTSTPQSISMTIPNRQPITISPTPAPPSMTTTSTTPPPPGTQPPLCNYSCADVITLHQVSPLDTTTTPQQVIDTYINNSSSSPSATEGCTALTLPFTATASGAAASLLLHIASPLASLNTTYPLADRVLTTTKPDAMQVVVVAAKFTLSGVVMVVDVRRVDANPTSTIKGSIAIPEDSILLCTPSDYLLTPHNGLPWANVDFSAPPTPLNDGERTVVAITAFAAADLQTVAAIGMLRCSPGSDEDVESEAGIRALVPVALSGTCAGAVQGALLAIGAAGVLSVMAMSIVKTVKKLSWVEAAAMVRCPGVVIAVWAFVQMGLVVCGARLTTGGSDVVLGVVGVLAGALLPIMCIGLAWGVVSVAATGLHSYPRQ